jgi:Zn-dependent protease
MIELNSVQLICVWALPILFAITFHEAAHAYVAYLCGDNTAKQMGRLSINPFHHFDLVGSLIVPLTIAIISQFHLIFGWATPVPISWNKLKNPRFDMAKVALAGPLSNFAMAFIFWLIWKNIIANETQHQGLVRLFFIETTRAGVLVNVFLGWLNLFPLPPLDGSRLLSACLPPRLAYYYSKLEPYGILILLILILSGVFQLWLRIPLRWLNI